MKTKSDDERTEYKAKFFVFLDPPTVSEVSEDTQVKKDALIFCVFLWFIWKNVIKLSFLNPTTVCIQ